MMIKSCEIQSLDDYSKKLINQGVYFLYSIIHTSAKYILKADKDFFLLNERGDILEKKDDFDFKDVQESVYFSDLELPPSVDSIKKIA